MDHFNGDRLNDLERRLDESTSLCTTLVEQLETVAHLDMPDMQAQIEALQDEQKKANEKFEAHLSDIQALKDLVRGLCNFFLSQSLWLNRYRQISKLKRRTTMRR